MIRSAAATQQTPEGATRRLRTAYIAGLIIIASLAGTKAYISSVMIDSARFDARTINIAGRQRMLSQKITKAALRYEHAATPEEAVHARAELSRALSIWTDTHEALRFGSPELGLPGVTHPDLELAYANIQPGFDAMRSAAQDLLTWANAHDFAEHRAPEVLASIDTILLHERSYLPAMNAIVEIHETRADQRIEALAFAKNLLFFATLVALLLEVIIVFEPAVRMLARQLRESIAQREKAEALARHKAEFLTNMSHEIRTPMAAILGFADLLLEPNLPAHERAERIQIIRTNGEHLLGLINDILDMSKIEAGKLDIECAPCDPNQLVEDTMSLVRQKAQEKGLTIRSITEGEIPRVIHADPLRVRQILVNLMGNAIKFTNRGSVFITSQLIQNELNHWLEIAVTDTGIGIEEDQLAQIFDAFTQADLSTTNTFGGTGLGLSISKNLAQAMGGTISVDSIPGEGSTFTLRLPAETRSCAEAPETVTDGARPPARPDASTTSDKPLENVRILLAEDGIDNQKLITLYLERAGAQVTLVDNGKDALDVASSRTNEFDLILMDMQMPGLNGLVATSSIRELGITLPILALTANAMQEDRQRCMTAGCDDFLTKPIDAPKLIRACADWAKRAQAIRAA